MKVIFTNPVFADYRVPFHQNLYNYFNGNYTLITSQTRMEKQKPKVIPKIKSALGSHVLFLDEVMYSKLSKSDLANTGYIFSFPRGLLHAVKKLKPELIITEGFFQWTPFLILYSLFFRTHLFMLYERTAHTERNAPIWKIAHRKITNLFISGYLVNGVLTKEYLQSLGVHEKKIYIAGMAADAKGLQDKVRSFPKIALDNFRQEYIGKTGLLYLFTGLLHERKGVQYLLKAWNAHHQKYPDDILLIVGGGTLFDEFTETYRKENSIVFTGTVCYDEIYKFYAIADVFVMPTLEDNWSLVVPEAMACGLPIACSKYNGCYPELITPSNGIVFDPYDSHSVLNSLDFFHSRNLELLGQESIRIERTFSNEAITKCVYDTLSAYIQSLKQ